MTCSPKGHINGLPIFSTANYEALLNDMVTAYSLHSFLLGLSVWDCDSLG